MISAAARLIRNCPCACGFRRTPRHPSPPPCRGSCGSPDHASAGKDWSQVPRRWWSAASACRPRADASTSAARSFECRIVWVYGQRETRIGQRILVAAIDAGLRRQRRQASQRWNITGAVRSNSRPQPSANSVSPVKAMLGLGKMVGDMAGGVARRGDDSDRVPREIERRPFLDCLVDARDCRRLGLRADDLQPELLLQGEIGLDMVAVVMGGQDHCRRPARALDRGRMARSSGASISAVSPLLVSCRSTPKLSCGR